MAGQAIAVREPSSFAIMQTDPTELREALEVNTGGQRINPFDLDVVKVPSGGMTAWTIPDIIEGEIIAKTIDGIVILQRSVRSWWAKDIEEGGGGQPPDCSSQDAKWGTGRPAGHPDLVDDGGAEIAYEAYDADGKQIGGAKTVSRYACDACPLAVFGSAKSGRGQACKQNRLLFVLTADSALPLVVKAPPSSLRGIQSFFLRLSGKDGGIPMYGCVVSLSLKKATNANGIEYAEIVPAFVSRLTPDETARMKLVHESLKPILSAAQFEADI